jgi:plasmid stability protein
MSNLSIKNVPEAWAEALRQRAARNHRSLQGELMAILEQALVEPGPERLRGARQGWKTVEQVAAELRARYPDPIADQSNSIDLIREDRDSR